jgi:hypothetical protein
MAENFKVQDGLTFPDGTTQTTAGGGGNLGNLLVTDNTIESSDSDAYINFTGGPEDNSLSLGTNDGGPVEISTDGGGTEFILSAADGLGSITFPDGSIQTTAYPGNDQNVWVQTFVTDTPVTGDLVPMAISVEYDDDNNIIALFNNFDNFIKFVINSHDLKIILYSIKNH